MTAQALSCIVWKCGRPAVVIADAPWCDRHAPDSVTERLALAQCLAEGLTLAQVAALT